MEIKVSDHAIVRYLERVNGVNIAEVVSNILDERTVKAIETLGDGEYPLGDNYLVVKNNTVVTVK